MNHKNSEESILDCSTVGKGFARTENNHIASESCGLSTRGFANTDFGKQDEITQEDNSKLDCSTAGMGFARTDRCKIAPENCAFPTKGFATTDFGKKE
ncbi:hypothetical protein [Pelosinus sp. IPA-1]|uniref:hypothetical protein n=1 Tax=Pelosinus sp. IPA-1 TaxID=3029569 RepID=UPI002436233D|nr:hypothetical protein [Pelosinus sp. IPA-1]GMB00793.1 hypothetical protein PIPA1_35920 [Pelosinus sp. IPA-1]